MKVLFSIDSLLGGGTETSTLHLINLFSHNIDITVVYFYKKHDLKSKFLNARCNLAYLDLKGNYNFISGIFRLIRLIRKEKYDLIVTSLFRSGIMCRIAGFLTGTPVVDTIVNESYGTAKKKEFKGWHVVKFYAIRFIDRITAGIPIAWISNSASIANSMRKSLQLKEDKIHIIYRGRETEKFHNWDKGTSNIFQFASVGRLFPQKGFITLIDAFSKLEKYYPNVELIIYGEGPQRTELEYLIKDKGLDQKVFLPGRVPDAWKKLYEADCFVLPSFYEGFSGALVEAMLVGIPIIASDIEMNKEAIHHHETGLLHKVGDTESLLEQMLWMIHNRDSAVKMGKNARTFALEHYDNKKIAQAYEELLFSVVKKSKT